MTNFQMENLLFLGVPILKGLLHCFSTCIEITGNNWYCFILKNVQNSKLQRKIPKGSKVIRNLNFN